MTLSNITAETLHEFSAAGWAQAFGGKLCRQLSDKLPTERNVTLKTLKHTEANLVLQMKLGEKVYAIKAFNPEAGEALTAFNREVNLLELTQQTNLTPRLVAYDQEGLFIVTDNFGDKTLLSVVNPDTVADIAKRLGNWFQYFDLVAPSQIFHSDWDTYLQKTASHGLANLSDQTREFLSELPISQAKIAKNDAHLSNFLFDQEDKIAGIDFESATFKPRGWDILMTTRSLVKSCPGQRQAIVDAILSGWGQGADEVRQTDFRRVIEIFVQTTTGQTVLECPPETSDRCVLLSSIRSPKQYKSAIRCIHAKD